MKRVIIIGASSGIGESLAKMYAQQGCMVGIAARRKDNLDTIAKEYPDNIFSYQLDVSSDYESVKKCIFYFINQFKGVDIIVYCSGTGKQNSMLDVDIELNTINVNVKGFTFVADAVMDYAQCGNEFTFAVIASIASVKGIGVSASYSATKMYQIRYMESLEQLSNKRNLNAHFVTIKPGFIDTDLIKGRDYPMTMPLPYAAKLIKKAIDQRKHVKIIDWRWSIVVFFWKLIPAWMWRRMKI